MRWRGRDVRLMTLAEARMVTGRSFIKPAEEKCFEARVYGSGAELPGPGALPESLAVLVQEVVSWSSEFRCFVMDRKVETLSAYWREGKPARTADGIWTSPETEQEEALLFCQSVLNDPYVSVPRAGAIDVGVIQNHGWAVIECNAAWGAGIYGCDPVAVLRALRRSCERRVERTT